MGSGFLHFLAFAVLATAACAQSGSTNADPANAEYHKDHVKRCREPPRPGVLEPVFTLPSTEINICGRTSVKLFLPANQEVSHISHSCLTYMCLKASATDSPSAEVVAVVEIRGSIIQLDVNIDGDNAHWTVRLPPTAKIRDQSCYSDNSFCDAVSATPYRTGFFALDRHRVMEFSYPWLPEASENLISYVGQVNTLYGSNAVTLHFPTAAAVYQPYNETHITNTMAVDLRRHPHAGKRLVFVTDTGNHRVVMLNTTASGQLTYAGHFGVTGIAKHGSQGLDTPWGIAVYAPTDEALFGPIFANVFVTDRRNNRVVKLNVGYPTANLPGPGSKVVLSYSGEYGSGAGNGENLREPAGIALYRHYILVVDVLINGILVLMVDHNHTNRFRYVTRLNAALGVRLLGSIATTPLGYVWFSEKTLPDDNGISSIFLTQEFRWSTRPNRLEDFIRTCVNSSFYSSVMRFNVTLYIDLIGFALNASGINWLFPDRDPYMNIRTFNRSTSFDIALFNATVFKGRMQLCQPPPPPKPPEMLSGNQDGWNSPGKTAGQAGSAPCLRPQYAMLIMLLFVFAVWA